MNRCSSVLVIVTAAVVPKLSCLLLKAAITDIFGMLVFDCFNVHAYEQSHDYSTRNYPFARHFRL